MNNYDWASLKSNTMKKIFYLFMLFLYVVGVLGGIGYTIYYMRYVTAAGIAAAGYMAFPVAKDYFQKLIN